MNEAILSNLLEFLYGTLPPTNIRWMADYLKF